MTTSPYSAFLGKKQLNCLLGSSCLLCIKIKFILVTKESDMTFYILCTYLPQDVSMPIDTYVYIIHVPQFLLSILQLTNSVISCREEPRD